MKCKKRLLTIILSFLLIAVVIPTDAFAVGLIETNRNVSFNITYVDGKKSIQGAAFDIYRVADVDAYGELTLTGSYKAYPVDTAGLSQEEWLKLALTLKSYTLRDHLTPDESGETDANGKLTSILKPGLYLVIGSKHVIGKESYTPTPFMVFLPGLNESENNWDYSVTVIPKFTKNSEVTSCKVLKIWDDKGYEGKRPKEITVQLLKDGVVSDTKTLTEKDNWRYTWNGLDPKCEWTVVEKELEGYSVTIDLVETTFTVTNKYKEKSPPIPNKPHKTVTGKKLPQTGVVWWPVPVLIALGLISIILGVLWRKLEKDES